MKRIIVYSLLLAFLAIPGQAKDANDSTIFIKKEFSKTIKKSFPIDKKGEVLIVNKYGNIDMHTWDKAEVMIEVKIKVNASSKSVAGDVFDRISIHFDSNRDWVSAETEIETVNDYWWNWGRSSKSDFEINYKVYMPISCSIDFSNKYGDIDLMDLENNAKLSVKYGNLTMGDLESDLELYLGYGKAFIGNVGNVQMELGYSKFRCESMNKMKAETKYSSIYINRAGEISVDSKYDNYDLGTVKVFKNEGKYDNLKIEKCNRIQIDTKYTDLKIGSLSKELIAEMAYGGVDIKELHKGFDEIRVKSKYTGVDISTQKGSAYKLILESRYLSLSLPDTGNIEDVKDGSERRVKAVFNGGSNSKMFMEMEYGHLKIK